jgi:DNA-binding protein H-NS
MAKVSLANMDVDALLELRGDVERTLAERGRELERQLAALGLGGAKRGRPPGKPGRTSTMKGVKVAPKYRGPGGETWAGRGATPRWLRALLDEGHSIEEFAIGKKGGKRAAAVRKVSAKKGREAATKKRGRKAAVTKEEAEAAGSKA